MILYNLKNEGYQYRITKFDSDMNPESSYLVHDGGCECPQGHKPTCRHRKMLGACLSIMDSEFFYCFDTGSYHTANGAIVLPGIDFGQQAQPVSTKPPAEPSFRRRV